jgi:hypothetical protein
MNEAEILKAFRDWANSRSLPTGYVRRVRGKSNFLNPTTEEAWQAWKAATTIAKATGSAS